MDKTESIELSIVDNEGKTHCIKFKNPSPIFVNAILKAEKKQNSLFEKIKRIFILCMFIISEITALIGNVFEELGWEKLSDLFYTIGYYPELAYVKWRLKGNSLQYE